MKLKILQWTARVLAILSILILMIFSLDVFEGEDSLMKKLTGFLVHNIPALILIIALILSWRYEVAGGLLFIVSFIGLGIFFKSFSGNYSSLILITPLLITGILFIMHHFLAVRKEK